MTEIKPALTAEEWTEDDGWNTDPDHHIYGDSQCNAGCCVDRPHAMAAACLHDQPFGFTREMVEAIRHLAIGATYGAPPGLMEVASPSVINARAAADRIEALLPPEEIHATQEPSTNETFASEGTD